MLRAKIDKENYSLSILVPVYNEEASVENILSRLELVKEAFLKKRESKIDNVQIVIINDGSTDLSAEKILRFQNFKLINFKENRGYGFALKSGFNEARGDLISFLDADESYVPEELNVLCNTMLSRDADLIVGSRLLERKFNMPIHRFIGNALVSLLFSFICNRKVTDLTSGMRIIKKEAYKKIGDLPNGLDFSAAMTVKAIGIGYTYAEESIRYEKRKGRSKLNPLFDSLVIFLTMLRYAFRYFKFRVILLLFFSLVVTGIISVFLKGLSDVH